MQLKIGKKLKTASLKSRFTGSEEERTSTCITWSMLLVIAVVCVFCWTRKMKKQMGFFVKFLSLVGF